MVNIILLTMGTLESLKFTQLYIAEALYCLKGIASYWESLEVGILLSVSMSLPTLDFQM